MESVFLHSPDKGFWAGFHVFGLSVVIAGLYFNTEFNVLKDKAVPFITLTVSSVSHL